MFGLHGAFLLRTTLSVGAFPPTPHPRSYGRLLPLISARTTFGLRGGACPTRATPRKDAAPQRKDVQAPATLSRPAEPGASRNFGKYAVNRGPACHPRAALAPRYCDLESGLGAQA